MKKVLMCAIAILCIIGCGDHKKKEEVKEKATVKNTKSAKLTQNYAVVFKWDTKDEKLVEQYAMQQADQLLKMWKENKVENVYYDSEAKVDKFSYFPNISFFLKAENQAVAEKMLNDLIVVKKGISTYTIYPVGTLWLKRKKEKVSTTSYVAVWSTVFESKNTSMKKTIDEHTKDQSDEVLKLWSEGKIENVYFDIPGTVEQNDITDFVFFVNANTEEEAKEICSNLPFAKKQLATFKLFQVGVFWMGIND